MFNKEIELLKCLNRRIWDFLRVGSFYIVLLIGDLADEEERKIVV